MSALINLSTFTRLLSRLFVVSLSGLATIAFSPARSLADVRGDLHTVAITGDAAPQPGGGTLSLIDWGTIAPNGSVVFHANLAAPGNPALFFGSSPTTLQPVAAALTPAPGTNAMFLGSNMGLAINQSNEVVAAASLINGNAGASNDQGIWTGQPTVNALVVRQGSSVAVPTTQFLGPFITNTYTNYTPVLNDAGQVAFQSGLQKYAGQPISSAVADWVTFGSSLSEIAATGGVVPGLPPGTTFTSLGTPGINDNGTVVYSGAFHGSLISGTAIFGASPGSGGVIAGSGQQVIGMAPGVTFASVSFGQGTDGSQVHLNNINQTVFYGLLTGPGITSGTNDRGVFIGAAGGIPPTLLAQTGTAAPGLPSGTIFTSFNDIGLGLGLDAGFLARVSGPSIQGGINDVGIWVNVPGSEHLVVRDGDVIPDGSNGPLTVTSLQHFTMNANGQILTQTGNGTLLGTNEIGQLTIVARPGDSIQVAPGDFRTIQSIGSVLGGNTSGGSTQLNDLGLVSFQASFTDGTSGVFVSNALAVPEPSTWLLAAVGICMLAVMKRKHAGFRTS